MNRRNLIILAGAVLLAFGAILIWANNESPTDEGHAHEAEGEHHDEEGDEHAHDEDTHEDEASELNLSAAQIAKAGIELAVVGEGGSSQILVPAIIAANQSGRAIIDARASGVIQAVSKNLGDYVRRGETVARIESGEAASLAAALNAARARVSQLSSNYQRERRLYEANVTARQDLEAAEANLAVAQSELSRAQGAAAAAGVSGDGRSLAVTSPLSGRVARAPIMLGSYVNAGDELYHVVNDAGLQVEASLSSQDVARIKVGDAAQLLLSGGREIPARVRSITPTIDTESRSATAVLSLLDTSPDLQVGGLMQVRIEASRGAPDNRMIVPEAAVQTIDGEQAVFVRTDHGFRVQPVTIGDRSGGRVVILSGLKPGTKVATTNAFSLKSELEKEGASHAH